MSAPFLNGLGVGIVKQQSVRWLCLARTRTQQFHYQSKISQQVYRQNDKPVALGEFLGFHYCGLGFQPAYDDVIVGRGHGTGEAALNQSWVHNAPISCLC
jgi:hypothetical protein